MNYIKTNKTAWEEAFDNRKPNWGEQNHILLKKEKLYFFNVDMRQELEKIDIDGKIVAQFCCNNGRELLSLMDLGAKEGFGFDIADNIIGQAKNTAEKAGINNCEFISCNLLDIHEIYHNRFDFIFFTIGAINWFKDLNLLFGKVSKCLKSGGILLIHEKHPFMDMLPYPGEKEFNPDDLNRFISPYFRKEPWIDNSGMSYMSVEYKSETQFTDFTHTISGVLNGLLLNSMKIIKFNEYDYDIMGVDVYNNKGLPLSYILIAEKCSSCV